MRPPAPPLLPGPPEAVLLHLPASPGDIRPTLLHLAVAADPWPGALAIWRSRDGAGFALTDTIGAPALIGRTLSVLPAGPVWRWDDVSSLTVRLSGGALTSIGRTAALDGGNLLAVVGPDGAAEILSAARAELVGDATYRLSDLLRGLGGTEAEARRPVPAGATCVVLDGAVLPLAASPEEIGRPTIFRIAPAGRDHSDPLAVERIVTPTSLALRPLAPVRLAAMRRPEGVRIGWIRRTRRDGDNWNLVEIPLAEEREAYEVDILKAGAAIRTLRAGEPTALYAAADEIADFGAPQPTLAIAVSQVSATTGRGRAASATLAIF